MTVLALPGYRRALWDERDELFLRCLSAASAAGLIAMIVMLLLPRPARQAITMESVSPRMARLILEPPKPAPVAAPKPRPAGEVVQAERTPEQAPEPAPMPVHPRRAASRALADGAGQAGRERAVREVASLAATSASLDHALDGLSASLGAASGPGAGSGPARPGRTRGVRAARGAEALGGGAGGLAGGGRGVDLGGSIVVGSSIAVGSLEGGLGGGGLGAGGSGGGAAAESGGGSGAAPGVYRSNASLLAVIQRYAAGIQYCYGSELKREPSLRGKLVVAITVAASGEVTEATVVSNSTGSSRLSQCALSQIRDWRFPAIAQGVTTFQAPFVFTPPQ